MDILLLTVKFLTLNQSRKFKIRLNLRLFNDIQRNLTNFILNLWILMRW